MKSPFRGIGHVMIIATLMAIISTAAVTAQAPVRERIRLDAEWRLEKVSAPTLTRAVPIQTWRWMMAPPPATGDASPTPPPISADWKSVPPGQDVFGMKPGYAWFATALPALSGSGRVVNFEDVDDTGIVYLNGKRLARHEGFKEPFSVPLDAAWKSGGPNVLAVLVQNLAGPGRIGAASVGIAAKTGELRGDPSQPGYNDRGWRVVHLPHDFVIEGRITPSANRGHGYLPVGEAWYRKTFTPPDSARGKSLWIDFDGIYRDSTVWLNGQKLGEHPSGYTSFRYDITRVVRFGERNTLAVYVDARKFEGWWYEGGGIYRHVWLNATNPLHVAPWGTYVTSQLPEPGPGGAPSATIHARVTVANDGGLPRSASIVSEIVDDAGRVAGSISTPVTVVAGKSQEVPQQIVLEKPHLWSPDSPYLYHLVTRVVENGRAIDSTTTPFGVRTLRFDPDKGFFLNGQPLKLKGTCNHQDFSGVGIAMPDRLIEWRVRKLKEMGANAYRFSHNEMASELLDACDRLGMMVMDENRHLGDSQNPKTPAGTPAADLSDLADMIRRDRNHPSIILWSMCNEETLQGQPEGARIFSAMMDVVHRYDTTRPITSAMSGGFGRGFSTVEEVQGINYHVPIYDSFHAAHPTLPLFGSETISPKSTRGIYNLTPGDGYLSSYAFPESSWGPVAERPFMAGSFFWVGFDYMGEPNPYGWPQVNSHAGVMDRCGFPKDNYYYYKAWWGEKPLVHLFPHWNWPGKEGQPVRVVAYSNCDRIELFLNGKSQGIQPMPRYGHVEWNVPYAPGTLEARAYQGDRIAATDGVETTGPPAALQLTTDRSTLAADGEDVTLVDVAVLDAQGRVVPIADNLVTFRVTGAAQLAGVGNGNPTDHDPDKASQRHAFNGLCMAVIGAGERAGDITVAATSPGLRGATIRLRAE